MKSRIGVRLLPNRLHGRAAALAWRRCGRRPVPGQHDDLPRVFGRNLGDEQQAARVLGARATRRRDSGGVRCRSGPSPSCAVPPPARCESGTIRPPASGVRIWNSSETVARRGSREEIRAASGAAASVMGCASILASVVNPNNSANPTRTIGNIILFACHEAQDKLQQQEA